ncbi:MAG TPA: hypothetical protein DCX03_05340 [Bacteroidales bacterium]|jgi:oligosaccharide repeat unit polymerase|nr:hypothetical protein [Bacteroidales bacterium]
MYLIVSIIILIISFYLFKKAAGTLDIRQINMCSFVFYMMFFFVFVGSIRLLYYYNDLFYYLYDTKEDTIFFGWLVVMYTFLMLPAGMILAQKIFKIKSMKFLLNKYGYTKIQEDQFGKYIKHVLFLFSLVSGITVIYIFYLLGSYNPLLNLMSGVTDYTLLYQQRKTTSSNLLDSRFLSNMVTQIASYSAVMFYVAYVYWRKTNKISDQLWFIGIGFFAILNAVYSIAKGPIIYLILGFFLLHVMIKGKIKISHIVYIVFISLFLTILLFIFFQGYLRDPEQYYESYAVFEVLYRSIEERVFVGQVVNYFNVLEIFPYLQPYLWLSTTGQIIHDIAGLTYFEDYGVILMSYVDPLGYEIGTAGHATTFFMGEAWANFGFLGILIAPFYVGFFIQTINIFFLKAPKTPIYLASYVYITLNIPILTAFKGFYYPAWLFQYFVLISVLFIMAYILNGSGVKNENNPSSS